MTINPTMPKSQTFVKLLIVALLLGPAAFTVVAQGGKERFTQDELKVLPRACLAQTFISESLNYPIVPKEEREQWYAALGGSFIHYHHYCYGLMYMRKAVTDSSKQNHYYHSASANFEYVINNATRDFPLLPEVYLRKGIALRFLGEDAAAATEFTKALKLKPDYTPAYAALVELHIDLGDIAGARSVLETGLSHAPASKILAEKKAYLEGHITKRQENKP